jgi:phospholipid/cholesterol/gamma-HCH transport system ATP-binding protein
MSGADVVIEVRDLHTRFGRTFVLAGIDLEVRRGEVLSVVGGSGSGKTTLLRQMLGLDRHWRGSVKVLGFDLQQGNPQDLARLRTRWGVLFQAGALFSALSVFDNVALPLRELRLLPEDLIRDIVMLKLEMVGIEYRHTGKLPAELSGGMVKRVALARALALDPELLFLDEPTAGLDPARSDSFVDLVGTLRRELNLTVVMVSHDLDTVAALSDRVAVLAQHRLVAVGSLAEVAQSDHPVVVGLLRGARGRRVIEDATGTLGLS